MLTVDDHRRTRTAHRYGMNTRAIARTLHYSRRKIREVLAQALHVHEEPARAEAGCR